MKALSKHRLEVLRQLPENAVCAEIGVWRGDFSRAILTATSPRELHLIDPWLFQAEYPERMYGGAVAKSQADMDMIRSEVTARFANHRNVIVHVGKSADVLATFDDHYFDWVYIDGNHYYEYVYHDLNLCYTKVRQGGVICGDDYLWGAGYDYPVKRAVHAFVDRYELKGRLQIIGTQYLIRT